MPATADSFSFTSSGAAPAVAVTAPTSLLAATGGTTLIVGVQLDRTVDTAHIKSITFDGDHLTLLKSVEIPKQLALSVWHIHVPPPVPNVTADVVVTLSAAASYITTIQAFGGTLPLRSWSPTAKLPKAATGTDAVPTVTTDAAVGDIIADLLAVMGLPAISKGNASQVLGDVRSCTVPALAEGSAGRQAGAASVTSAYNLGTFPTAPLLTDFTGADESPISEGGRWAGPAWGAGAQLRRVSNKLQAVSANGASYLTASQPQDCEFRFTIGGTLDTVYLLLRVDSPTSAGLSGYALKVSPGTSQLVVQRYDPDSATAVTLATYAATITAGDRYGARMIGSRFEVWRDVGSGWVLMGSVVDTTYLRSGSALIWITGTATTLDDLYGGAAPGTPWALIAVPVQEGVSVQDVVQPKTFRLVKSTTTDVVNTITLTDILDGEMAIPANLLGALGVLRLRAWGDYLNNSGATKTLRVAVLLGGFFLYDDTTGAIPSDADRAAWFMDLELQAPNSTQLQLGGGLFYLGGQIAVGIGTGSIDGAASIPARAFLPARGTVNMTAAQTLELSFAHSVAHASTSIRCQLATLEVLNP